MTGLLVGCDSGGHGAQGEDRVSHTAAVPVPSTHVSIHLVPMVGMAGFHYCCLFRSKIKQSAMDTLIGPNLALVLHVKFALSNGLRLNSV